MPEDQAEQGVSTLVNGSAKKACNVTDGLGGTPEIGIKFSIAKGDQPAKQHHDPQREQNLRKEGKKQFLEHSCSSLGESTVIILQNGDACKGLERFW